MKAYHFLPILARNGMLETMSRSEHKIDIRVNGVKINKVIIDPHYKEKHSESITDEIILELVKALDGKDFEPEAVKDEYSYFVSLLELSNKNYKLIWLMEEDELYIGVINAYRR